MQYTKLALQPQLSHQAFNAVFVDDEMASSDSVD